MLSPASPFIMNTSNMYAYEVDVRHSRTCLILVRLRNERPTDSLSCHEHATLRNVPSYDRILDRTRWHDSTVRIVCPSISQFCILFWRPGSRIEVQKQITAWVITQLHCIHHDEMKNRETSFSLLSLPSITHRNFKFCSLDLWIYFIFFRRNRV